MTEPIQEITLKQKLIFTFLFIFIFLFTDSDAQVNVNPGNVNYTSLRAAFTAINNGTHTGAIIIRITSDCNEGSSTITLNASGSGAASYTSINITPSGGVVRTIAGTTTPGNPFINFNGADNVTIDGLQDKGSSLLIIQNLTSSSTAETSTIRFIGGATNNTITRCIIKGAGSADLVTNSGVIFFSTDAVTGNGNDNNTISKCDIGPFSNFLPSKCIMGYGSTSTTAAGNSGIVINDNDVHDYFNSSVNSAGIVTINGCNTWSVTNNRFYQTSSRTWTTGVEHNAINLGLGTATSGMSSATISGNIIGYSSNTQTGNYILSGSTGKFIGVKYNGLTGTGRSTISNNTVAGISLTGIASSGTTINSPFIAIMVVNGLAVTNNNIIGSQSATGSIIISTTTTLDTDIFGLYYSSLDNWAAAGNQVGGMSVTVTGISGNTRVCLMGFSGLVNSTDTLTGNLLGGNVSNSIQLSATGVYSQVIGIQTSGGRICNGNTIRNLTSNTGSGTTTSASVIGININNTVINHAITQNTIHSLSNTNTSAATTITGIEFTGGSTNTISGNFIHSFSVAGTAGVLNGIQVSGGNGVYANNMIRLGINAAGGAVSTCIINGINETAGANNFYYNSIYIGGTGIGGSANTVAFNSTVSGNSRIYQNNIFFNARSNGTGTGKHYAFRYGGSGINPPGLTTNNNVYYTSGSGGILAEYNASPVNSIASVRSNIGQDAGSFSVDPQFLLPDGTSATVDLHINTVVATPVESGASAVTVTDDFDGNIRSLTSPDIGADEGTFIQQDLAPPVIADPSLQNIVCVTNRTFQVSITDATGINSNTGTRPRVYYRKSTNNDALGATNDNTTNGWKYVETSNASGPYSFTLNNNLIFGGVAAGDTIQYFIIAQDMVTPVPFVGVTGAILSENPSSVALTASAFPTSNQSSFKFIIPLTGNVNVGPGETYTSLSGAGGLFSDINNRGMEGDVIAYITGNIATEDGSFALNTINYGCSGSSVLTIKPTGTYTVSGSNSNGLIKINAADNIIIDGSVGSTINAVCPSVTATRDLTFINTSSSSISGVIFFLTNGTDGVNNTIIRNCNIKGSGSSQTYIGIGMIGASIANIPTATHNNNQIINNNIGKVQMAILSRGINAAFKNTGNIFNLNKLDNPAPDNIGFSCITVLFEDNVTISGNSAGGLQASTSGDKSAISVGFSTYAYTVVSDAEVTNATISNNVITNVSSTHSSGFSAIGIGYASAATGTTRIYNNMISGVVSFATATNFAAGIFAGGGAGNLEILNNTVVMTGARSNGAVGGTSPSYALAIGGTTPNVSIQNNILVNTQTSGNVNPGKSFAIGLAYSSTIGNYSNLVSSNNNLYAGGAQGILAKVGNFAQSSGTALNTLVDWQTETGKDINSQNQLPVFVSASDLHLDATDLTNAMYISGKGIPLASVPGDIDCETRSTSFPDIGADELDVCYASGGIASVGGPICTNNATAINGTGYAAGSGTSYQWEYSADDFVADIHDLPGQINPVNAATGILTSTTYYRLKVGCSIPALTTYSNVVTVHVDPLSMGGSSINQAVCSGSQPSDVILSGNTGTVVKWQRSTDAAFTSPTDIANTTTTLSGATIGNLTATTYFRAVVQSGVCATANSASVTITVDPVSVGGTVSSNQTICSGTQPANVTLSGNTGSVVKWQRSTNVGFTSPTDIANTTTTLSGATIGNLTATTYFRAVVQSGVCATANSSTVTITVDPVSVGGTVSSNQTICSGTQPANLTLSGNTGNVTKWQRSTDAAFTSPTDIANTTTTLSGATIGNLTATTYFRAVVQSGVCATANSSTVTITVDPVSVGGTVSSNQTICSGTQPANLTLSGNTGNVTKWQRSSDAAFTSPTDIANTTTTLSGATIGNLTATTYFRAVVQSGVCAAANSSSVTITVDPVSVGGTVSSAQTICIGNSLTSSLTLSGNTGTVLKWQRAADAAFTSPTDITNASATLTAATAGALITNTYFRAVVQSGGVCASANSSPVLVTVNSSIDNTTVLAGTTGGAQVSATYNISASNNYLSNCALIATVAPSGASPVSGVVTAAVKIDNTVLTAPNSQPYVQRYFNITPAANAATATSIITLYFKQAEFTAYNVARGTYPALPTGASDATGIANLRITQYNGTGTAPGNYTGTASIIDPADANITYNATADRWSISFTATGSGGFYVHTGTWILPVTITAFNGENAGSINKLYWNTSSETNSKGFELERSADGVSFTRIAFVATKANGGNSNASLNYTYDDKRPLVGANYYRLKQIDNDGKYAYSNVVLLNRKVTEIMITKLYPNPASTELNVQITSPRSEKLTLVVTDLTGKTVMQQSMNIVLGDNQQQLQIGALAGGTYMLKAVCANGCETAVQRFVKQ